MKRRLFYLSLLLTLFLMSTTAFADGIHADKSYEDTYAYKELAKETNGSNMQQFFKDLYISCEEFVSGEDTISDDLIVDSFDITQYNITLDEAAATWKVFGVTYPEYYWMINSLNVSGTTISTVTDSAYLTFEQREVYNNAINQMITECSNKITEAGANSELEKSEVIFDYITDEIYYAYKEDGVTPEDASWAHSIVGVAYKGSGVCESYAKTFTYLCEKNGIDSLIVTGLSGNEEHAWNMLELDGAWFYVDATWADSSSPVDKTTYFAVIGDFFTDTHISDTADGTSVKYLYDLPEVSKTRTAHVDLYKNNVLIREVCNLNQSFSYMTDEAATYTVVLYEGYNFTYIEEFPTVKKIIFKDYMSYENESYYTTTSLQPLSSYVTRINSDIELYNTQFMSNSAEYIDLGAYTITLSGKSSQMMGAFESRVNNQSKKLATIIAAADNNTLIGDGIISVKKIIQSSESKEDIGLVGNIIADEVKANSCRIYSWVADNTDGLGATNITIGKYIPFHKYDNDWGSPFPYASLDIMDDRTKVTINTFESTDSNPEYNYTHIRLAFSSVDNSANLSITNSLKSKLEICLDGMEKKLTGNSDLYTYFDPLQIRNSILKLPVGTTTEDIYELNATVWSKDRGGYYKNVKPVYTINHNGELKVNDAVDNNGYLIANGVLYGYRGTASALTIPNSVKKLELGALSYNNTVRSINIPSTVTNIGLLSFIGCPNLQKVVYDGCQNCFNKITYNNQVFDTGITATYAYSALGCHVSVSAKNYSGVYDKKSHTISLSGVPTGATVTYSTSKNGKYTTTKPTRTNAGTTTVYYKVTKSGYRTVTGSATIKISRKKVTGKKIKLSTTSYVYNGKTKKPTVVIRDDNGNTISSENYTITYSKGRKNVGKYTVKVTFKNNYSGSKTLTFKINPKSTSISKLTAGSKKFTVKWKKQSTQTTGYQIQYSTSKKFSGAKTVTVSKNSTTKKTISKLKAKKKYYVRIRTYKTVNGTKYYSSWSSAKYVTTKK